MTDKANMKAIKAKDIIKLFKPKDISFQEVYWRFFPKYPETDKFEIMKAQIEFGREHCTTAEAALCSNIKIAHIKLWGDLGYRPKSEEEKIWREFCGHCEYMKQRIMQRSSNTAETEDRF